MAEKSVVDELTDLEFFREMMKFFGVRRATEIFGFAVVMGASGKTLPSEIVHALVKVGFTRSGVYRALTDIKRFVQKLEHDRGRTVPMDEILAEINAGIVAAGASHAWNDVV